MLSDTTPLRREEVYRRLRADILSCTLSPGANLHEAELADRFAISKSPIRDALLRLEAEKLVIVVPRKGYHVAPVSVADARDLFEFRVLLEQTCAMSTAEHASDADLASLDRFRSADAWQPPNGTFVSYNREFHSAVASMGRNRRMSETACTLIEQLDRLVAVSVSALADNDTGILVAEHAAIIDALQERDGRGAARLLERHITRAKKRIMDALTRAAVIQ